MTGIVYTAVIMIMISNKSDIMTIFSLKKKRVNGVEKLNWIVTSDYYSRTMCL